MRYLGENDNFICPTEGLLCFSSVPDFRGSHCWLSIYAMVGIFRNVPSAAQNMAQDCVDPTAGQKANQETQQYSNELLDVFPSQSTLEQIPSPLCLSAFAHAVPST